MEKVLGFGLVKTDSLVFPVQVVQTQAGNLTGAHSQCGRH